MTIRVLIALLAVMSLFAAAQEKPSGDQGAVIRISTNLVNVPVSVLDSDGKPVRGLTAQDFRVEEEGTRQKVVSLGEPGKAPIALALVYDISGSVTGQFEFERGAAANFLRSVLRPGDSASVFTIGMDPARVQAQTADVSAAVAAVNALQPTREGTAFFDSVVAAAHYLRNTAGAGTRRVILAISDGVDNQSDRHNVRSALREIQRSEVTFYSINPGGSSIHLNHPAMKGQQAMSELAAETGGAFAPVSDKDLNKVFQQIAAELQAQYLLGYYSSDERADGRYRRIAVSLPSHPQLRVRARAGYYGPSASLSMK